MSADNLAKQRHIGRRARSVWRPSRTTIGGKVDIGKLPGRAQAGGYLYVLGFSTGVVKVGSSNFPRSRIGNHASAAEAMGLLVTDCRLTECRDDFREIEKILINLLKRDHPRSAGHEYFSGTTVDEVHHRLLRLIALTDRRAARQIEDVDPSLREAWQSCRDMEARERRDARRPLMRTRPAATAPA